MTNSRGSMILEAVPVTIVIFAFISGLIFAAYLLFTRAWIQYQSEQAIYCQAVGSAGCSQQLKTQVRRFVPLGNISSSVFSTESIWAAEVQWHYRGYSFHVAKLLTPKLILKNRVLRW